MNRVIKLLLLTSIFTDTGFGFVEPILAIFINEKVVGGSILTAGIASSIYLVTKSVIQLPFSRYVDGHDNKVFWLKIGTCLSAVVPFIYIFANNIYFLYLAQFVYGISSALAYPTWLALWSLHLDKKRESFEWSLYSTTTGVGTAITAAVGGAIAQFVGFRASFVVVGVLVVIGSFILMRLENESRSELQALESVTAKA